jgi:hypothetical protein
LFAILKVILPKVIPPCKTAGHHPGGGGPLQYFTGGASLYPGMQCDLLPQFSRVEYFKMASFGNAIPPPSKPADANAAFADALKRAKEVR